MVYNIFNFEILCQGGAFFITEHTSWDSLEVLAVQKVQILHDILVAQLHRWQIITKKMWFQQDGPTVYIAKASMQVDREMFPIYIFSRFFDVPTVIRYLCV